MNFVSEMLELRYGDLIKGKNVVCTFLLAHEYTV